MASVDSEDPLMAILSSPEQSEKFRLFLESKHCEENLLFWVEAQQFQFSHSSISNESLISTAKEIFKKYFMDSSQFCLNVDAEHVKHIKSSLESNVNRNMFSEAQYACLMLLKNDSVPKFLRSKEYSKESDKSDKKIKKTEKRALKMAENLRSSVELNELVTQLDVTKESIVEFEIADVDKFKENLEKISSEEKNWITQASVAVTMSNSVLQSNFSLDSKKTQKTTQVISNELLWQKQIETLLFVFSSQKYRTINGFLAVLGKFWFGWDENVFDSLLRKKIIPSISSPFSIDGFSHQAALMQIFDTVRMTLEKFSAEFEFTANFLVLLTKITASNLPGVSLVPLLDEEGDSIRIGDFKTLDDFDEFVHDTKIFINSSWTNNEQDNSVTLLSLNWDEKDFKKVNSDFEEWHNSVTSSLLKELIKVEKERKRLAAYVLKAHDILDKSVSSSLEIVNFLNSLQDVTEKVIEKPKTEAPILVPKTKSSKISRSRSPLKPRTDPELSRGFSMMKMFHKPQKKT